MPKHLDSDSVNLGSSPSPPATENEAQQGNLPPEAATKTTETPQEKPQNLPQQDAEMFTAPPYPWLPFPHSATTIYRMEEGGGATVTDRKNVADDGTLLTDEFLIPLKPEDVPTTEPGSAQALLDAAALALHGVALGVAQIGEHVEGLRDAFTTLQSRMPDPHNFDTNAIDAIIMAGRSQAALGQVVGVQLEEMARVLQAVEAGQPPYDEPPARYIITDREAKAAETGKGSYFVGGIYASELKTAVEAKAGQKLAPADERNFLILELLEEEGRFVTVTPLTDRNEVRVVVKIGEEMFGGEYSDMLGTPSYVAEDMERIIRGEVTPHSVAVVVLAEAKP